MSLDNSYDASMLCPHCGVVKPCITHEGWPEPPAALVERATPEPAGAVFHQHYFVCPRCGQQWFTLERDQACVERAALEQLVDTWRLRAKGCAAMHLHPQAKLLAECANELAALLP